MSADDDKPDLRLGRSQVAPEIPAPAPEQAALEAMAAVEICPICNNGIGAQGLWSDEAVAREVGNLIKYAVHHCPDCHHEFDTRALFNIHGCDMLYTHGDDPDSYPPWARCLACGDPVARPPEEPDDAEPGGSRRFFQAHVCSSKKETL